MKLLKRIQSMFLFSKRISKLDKKVQDILDEQNYNDRLIRHHQKKLENLEKLISKEVEFAKQAMENADNINRKMSAALETAQAEVTTLKEITVPGLVECNEVLINRWRQESQIMAINSAMGKRE